MAISSATNFRGRFSGSDRSARHSEKLHALPAIPEYLSTPQRAANPLPKSESAPTEQVADRDTQGVGKVEETLIQKTPATVFDIDQDIAGHPRGQGQLFLGQALATAFAPNPRTHLGADTRPLRDTLGVVLAGTGGHAPQ